MKTYTNTHRAPDWASQSRVVHTDDGKICHRFSLQVMRKRSRHGGREKRGFNVWLYAGPVRVEIGTR